MSMAASSYPHQDEWEQCKEKMRGAIRRQNANDFADLLFDDCRDICLELLKLPIDGDAHVLHLVADMTSDGNAVCILEFLFGSSVEEEFRPDVNVVRNDTGDTPLIIASRKNLEQTVHFLLKHGADTDCVNYAGEGFGRTVATSGPEDSEPEPNDAFVDELIQQLQAAQTKAHELQSEREVMQKKINDLTNEVSELKDHIFRQSRQYLRLQNDLEDARAKPVCSKCSSPTLSLHSSSSPSRGPSRPPRPQRSPSPGDATVVMGSEQIHTSGSGTPHTPLRTSSFGSRSASMMSLVDRCSSERSVEEKRSVRENYRSLNGDASHYPEEDELEPRVVFGVEPMDITPRDHQSRTAGNSVFVDRFTPRQLQSNGVNGNGEKRDCVKSNKSVPTELNAFESGPSVSSLDEMTNARRNLQMGSNSERPVFSKDEVSIEPSKQH